MSKNAYVLDDHIGDDGQVTPGTILHNVASKRFDELEKKGLVREATADEVKAGSQHTIEEDESKRKGDDEDGEKAKAKPANKAAPKANDKAD